MPGDKERRAQEGPAANTAASPATSTMIVTDAAPPVAAEQLALARRDPWPCACCTHHPDRRPAIDRLRAETHRLGIAAWADRMMPLASHYRRWCA